MTPEKLSEAELAGRQYAMRDIEAQGEHYMRHLTAMTTECLWSKSDIAAELAHRDIELAKFRNALAKLCGEAMVMKKAIEPFHSLHRAIGTFNAIVDTVEARCKVTPPALGEMRETEWAEVYRLVKEIQGAMPVLEVEVR